ncbi:MAG: hypothetical protein E4H13_14335, partial [Calditrichales bacterium]
RIRRPDQIVVYESRGLIKKRTGRLFPRHFSLAISGTIHSTDLKLEAEAKGRILIRVRIIGALTAAPDNLPNLIRAGGWRNDAVVHALKEFDSIIQVAVKEFTQKHEIEDLSSEALSLHLRKKIGQTVDSLGLSVVSLDVLGIDPVDEKIAEAMQQQETARIIEETEKANQKARVAAIKARLAADEEITAGEHNLELKKFKLKKIELEEEAKLANLRVKEELERRKLQLAFDQKEIDLVKDHPELLLLTPQVARLAEASQNLPNARTVVNLSGKDDLQGTQLLSLFQMFLQNLVQNTGKSDKKKSD